MKIRKKYINMMATICLILFMTMCFKIIKTNLEPVKIECNYIYEDEVIVQIVCGEE